MLTLLMHKFQLNSNLFTNSSIGIILSEFMVRIPLLYTMGDTLLYIWRITNLWHTVAVSMQPKLHILMQRSFTYSCDFHENAIL